MAKPMPPRGDACEMARVTTLCDKLSTLSGKRNPGRKGPLVNTWASMMKKCTNAPLTPGASLMGPARGKRPRQGSQMPAGTMEMHYDYSFPSQREIGRAHV